MKIAMLSCNTGEGHNSTAKAVQNVLEQRGVTCERIDVLACLSPKFSRFLCNWHVRLYRYGPKIFDASYRAFERSESDPTASTPIYELLTLGVKKLAEQLDVGGFDAILCVHVFSGLMMTELRRTGRITLPCFFAATDYTCSPFVERCEMDGYFIPAADLAGEFIRAGLPAEKLIPSGIPVRQAFYSAITRQEARIGLGLPEQGQVLLMMCGSMGCGPMKVLAESLVNRLDNDTTVVAICGNNEKLLTALREIESSKLRPIGFTERVSDYMDAADLMVTKPGGLSSTEAANKHLPVVFINVVGGCESRNFNYFLSHGYGIGSSDEDEVLEQTLLLARYPKQLQRMRRNLQEDFRINSAVQIADCLMQAARKKAES